MSGTSEKLDYRLDFIRDTEVARILRPAGKPVLRPGMNVHVHDLREIQVNRQFATEIDVCRRKLSDALGPDVAFCDEAVCHIRKAHFELKLCWQGDAFINLSGASENLARTIADPNAPYHDKWAKSRADTPRVTGKSIVFTGTGAGSNYYHWIGEQMSRLALLAETGHLAKMDNIVVFVREPVSFIEQSVRLLFPEFKGNIVQIRKRSAYIDYALFFVPASMATRSKTEAAAPTEKRSAWGSVLHLIRRMDAAAEPQAVPRAGPITIVSRQGTGRTWLNEGEVAKALSPYGAHVIRADRMTVPQQQAIMRQSRLVIAKHGAGLANILFCKPGTRVIEVTARSYARRAWDFAKLAIARGLEYHVVVSDLPADAPYDHVAKPETFIPHPSAGHLHTGPKATAFILAMARQIAEEDVWGQSRNE